jgi:lipopolysaccharide export LptBFGC system permease protein LptF
MRLLDRYLLRELLLPLGICLGGFLVFWVAFDLFNDLKTFQNEQATFAGLARLYLIRLPDLLVTILPVGELLALLYALTHLARHNEITAIRAAGVSLWRICLPYFAVGALLSGGLYWLNEVYAPDAKEREERLRASWIDPHAAEASRLWRTNLNFQNRTDGRSWSIGAFNPATAELLQPRVAMFLPADARREVTADSGRWLNGRWGLTNGLEWLHRSASDPAPASRIAAYITAGEFGAPGDTLLRWDGGNTIVSNVLVLRSGLAFTNAASRQEWRVAEFVPTNGVLRGFAFGEPVGSGARRLLMAERGVWTNGQWRFQNVQEFLYRSGTDDNPVDPTFAEMDIPELTETPNILNSELRVSGLLTRNKVIRKPELSVAEVRNYLRLHPILPRGGRALLDTVMQARLAAPWTCLVVVFIAIPFSVPSGRRNVFFGVAGSIAMAFGYFVLQRVGFALGQSGTAPAWLAAWLPNLVFALLGLVLTARVK